MISAAAVLYFLLVKEYLPSEKFIDISINVISLNKEYCIKVKRGRLLRID